MGRIVGAAGSLGSGVGGYTAGGDTPPFTLRKPRVALHPVAGTVSVGGRLSGFIRHFGIHIPTQTPRVQSIRPAWTVSCIRADWVNSHIIVPQRTVGFVLGRTVPRGPVGFVDIGLGAGRIKKSVSAINVQLHHHCRPCLGLLPNCLAATGLGRPVAQPRHLVKLPARYTLVRTKLGSVRIPAIFRRSPQAHRSRTVCRSRRNYFSWRLAGEQMESILGRQNNHAGPSGDSLEGCSVGWVSGYVLSVALDQRGEDSNSGILGCRHLGSFVVRRKTRYYRRRDRRSHSGILSAANWDSPIVS